MKNITTDDFRFGTFVWGVVVTLLLGSIITGFILNDKHNHDFDIACVNSNKKLTYIVLEGDDFARKVCQ